MSQEPSASAPASAPAAWRRRVSIAAVLGVCLLAAWETVAALAAPLRAPSDEDWRAAAAAVRAGWKPGDLVVAAPAWADQVMRLHLGDLVPVPVAARLDDARFGRVWEVGQRGARAQEATGRVVSDARHGALRVRLVERPAPVVTYDFYDQWAAARVFRSRAGRADVPCARAADHVACPDGEGAAAHTVRPHVLEVGGALHRGLHAPPVDDATIVLEYPDVPLGRELAVGTGLHNVWWRRHGDGVVTLRVLVDGQEIGRQQATNRNGWSVVRHDTAARAGQRATVRFEITTDRAYARQFGFSAEARGLAGDGTEAKRS